jgi:hypothetical protein
MRTPTRSYAGAAANIEVEPSNHAGRDTGITAYRKNGGTLEVTAATADHASTRRRQLYDRCTDETSLDYLERVIV